MSAIVIGIDPGLTGALSRFENARLTDIEDMPAIVTDKASKGASIRDLIGGKASHEHRDIDKRGLAELLRRWTTGASAKIIRENVHTMPRQGVRSSGRFMEVVGIIDTIAVLLNLPLDTVEPGVWQRLTYTPADNKGACKHAAEVFPDWASHFKRTSIDHNRADAVMIGLYGVRYAPD